MDTQQFTQLADLDINKMQSKEAIVDFLDAQFEYNICRVIEMIRNGVTLQECVNSVEDDFCVKNNIVSLFDDEEDDSKTLLKEFAKEIQYLSLQEVLMFIDERTELVLTPF